MAAEKVELTDYVKKTDYATTSAAGVVKVGGLGVKMSNGELVLAPASSRQIKQGSGDTAPIIAAKEHEAIFYGLAKASGDETQKESSNPVGQYTDGAKSAIHEMIGVPSSDDIPDVSTKADKTDTVLETTLSRGRKEGTAIGDGSFAFGINNEASGYFSHAEGSNSIAAGTTAHTEGFITTASGHYSHSEGRQTTASGSTSCRGLFIYCFRFCFSR